MLNALIFYIGNCDSKSVSSDHNFKKYLIELGIMTITTVRYAVTHDEDVCETENRKLSTFEMAKFRIYIEMEDELTITGYKGSALHGGFGCALKILSPSTFQQFFQPPFSGDPPRPYIISPGPDQRLKYHPGDLFYFDMVLIGPAVHHFPICIAAFEYFGQKLGFGVKKSKFKLSKVDFFNSRNKQCTLIENDDWKFRKTSVLANQICQTESSQVSLASLNFHSYLRIKKEGKLVNCAPEFSLVIDRLLGRICTLSKFYNKENDPVFLRNEREYLLEKSINISSFFNNLRWEDWERYSSRQNTSMKFGGLIGMIQYRGELDPFVPYLQLGEWLHIGGKTTFGLGGYDFQVN